MVMVMMIVKEEEEEETGQFAGVWLMVIIMEGMRGKAKYLGQNVY